MNLPHCLAFLQYFIRFCMLKAFLFYNFYQFSHKLCTKKAQNYTFLTI
ncbi:Hypothetical protein BN2458_PEG0849 [Helicobacter typhlonius]|uniref:Uncharacterized protein n=1 Tax=Helicobacter typhlonius TaxID=76936 RepID=A0A0S4PVN9_9HELI|nr:Hypothetical protein BN2458_PEG0849 [Helicobacter typhlonius]